MRRATAFLILFEKLSPVECAIFLMRDILTTAMTTSLTSSAGAKTHCRQPARRARHRVRKRQATLLSFREEQAKLVGQCAVQVIRSIVNLGKLRHLGPLSPIGPRSGRLINPAQAGPGYVEGSPVAGRRAGLRARRQ
jgi:hypothetical protein